MGEARSHEREVQEEARTLKEEGKGRGAAKCFYSASFWYLSQRGYFTPLDSFPPGDQGVSQAWETQYGVRISSALPGSRILILLVPSEEDKPQ